MNSMWKAVVGVILIFILGWFGGALTTLVVARHKALVTMQKGPEAIAIILERQTTRNLGLDADHKRQLHALIVENLKQRLELQKQIQPQVKTVNSQTLQQINALLTPDQRQHFHDNLILFKERYGRNPFNVTSDDRLFSPSETENVGASSNAPAGTK